MNCNVSSQFCQIKNIYHFNLLIFILPKRHNTYLYAIITIIIVYKYKHILDHGIDCTLIGGVQPERDNNDLLVVDDAPGLHIDVFQNPTYHVIIWHELRSCSYFMKLRFCYSFEFGALSFILYISRIVWEIYNFVLQVYKNLRPGSN